MQFRQAGTITCGFADTLRGLAVDQSDRIYAVGDSAVKVLGASSDLQHEWATARPGHCVAVAADGTVWVGEAGQVEIFDAGGKLKDTWRDGERLGRVTAIGFLGDSVLVGDAADRCILRYSLDGKFRNTIGKKTRRKGFLIPNGIVDFSLDASGVIHVTNPGKHRVERYTPDDELLGHIGRFGGLDPAGFSGCCNPTNVTVVGRDRIYCTEKADPRAKLYDFEGNLLAVIASDVFDLNSKNMDIVVNSRGRVFVGDTAKRTILVFEETGA